MYTYNQHLQFWPLTLSSDIELPYPQVCSLSTLLTHFFLMGVPAVAVPFGSANSKKMVSLSILLATVLMTLKRAYP